MYLISPLGRTLLRSASRGVSASAAAKSAGLPPECVAHGLRKAALRLNLETDPGGQDTKPARGAFACRSANERRQAGNVVAVAMRALLRANTSMLFSRATCGAIEQTPRML